MNIFVKNLNSEAEFSIPGRPIRSVNRPALKCWMVHCEYSPHDCYFTICIV